MYTHTHIVRRALMCVNEKEIEVQLEQLLSIKFMVIQQDVHIIFTKKQTMKFN